MEYKFLVMDSSGDVARTEEWTCPSDAKAMERAFQENPSFGGELWRGEFLLSAFAGELTHKGGSTRH